MPKKTKSSSTVTKDARTGDYTVVRAGRPARARSVHGSLVFEVSGKLPRGAKYIPPGNVRRRNRDERKR